MGSKAGPARTRSSRPTSQAVLVEGGDSPSRIGSQERCTRTGVLGWTQLAVQITE